jgi:hypothetical protein
MTVNPGADKEGTEFHSIRDSGTDEGNELRDV